MHLVLPTREEEKKGKRKKARFGGSIVPPISPTRILSAAARKEEGGRKGGKGEEKEGTLRPRHRRTSCFETTLPFSDDPGGVPLEGRKERGEKEKKKKSDY